METEKVLHFLLHSITSYAIVLTAFVVLNHWIEKKSSILLAVLLSIILGLGKEYVIDFYPTPYQLMADGIGTFLGMGFCLLLL